MLSVGKLIATTSMTDVAIVRRAITMRVQSKREANTKNQGKKIKTDTFTRGNRKK